MKKTSTIKLVRTSVIVVFTLFCAISCTKIEEEVIAADSRQQVVSSTTRSYEEALSLAQKSIALVDKGKTRAVRFRSLRSERGQCVITPSTRSGESKIDTLMYVFNFEGNDGFSIIAANRAVDPVLAVAEKGNYTYGVETGVENFDFYMDAMAQSLADRVIRPIDTVRTTPKFKRVEVNESRFCDPLIPVNWGQESSYGAYCSNGISGCVATAIAQIMAYYRLPPFVETTYTDAPHAGETIALDWDYMINYSYGYQISALMREIGQRVEMDYSSPNSSGANPNNVVNCLISMGYSCSSGLESFEISSIRDALDERRPVCIDGRNAANVKKGHTWVADGYTYSRVGTEFYNEILIRDGFRPAHYEYVLSSSTVQTTSLVHYNWGWDGWYNGNYAPVNGIFANGTTFNGLKMITSIKLNIGY